MAVPNGSIDIWNFVDNVTGTTVRKWLRDSWARRKIVALQQAIAAIVVPTASTTEPQMDGTAAPGSSTDYARADHIHPQDTRKQDALSQTQLNAINTAANNPIYFGTCDTAAGTAAKVVTCPGFTLKTGARVAVLFTNAQNAAAPITLNVNNTGAITAKRVSTINLPQYYWTAGQLVEFVYDGSAFVMHGGGLATTTYYGITKLTTALTSTSTYMALTASAGKSLQDQINALSARITALGG